MIADLGVASIAQDRARQPAVLEVLGRTGTIRCRNMDAAICAPAL